MKKKYIITTTLILFSFLIGSSQKAKLKSITLKPTKDALLHGLSSEANKNYGDNAQLAADFWTFSGKQGVIRSAIDFDFSAIPEGAVIHGAYLSLYAWDSSKGLGQHSTLGGSNECYLQRIINSWDENTVTWNTQPSASSLNQVSIAASNTVKTKDYRINVTTLVRDMTSGNAKIAGHGFLLKLKNEKSSVYRLLNFASSDHSNKALHPKLVVSYTEKIEEETCINNAINPFDFSVYPNPVSGIKILSIYLKGCEDQTGTIRIYNSKGVEQNLKISTIKSNSKNLIFISNLPSGMYFLYVDMSQGTSKQTNYFERLIIQ